VSSDEDPIFNQASVGVTSGPLGAPVLGRVVGMLAARADCPIDRLDDALLVADAVAAKAGSFSEDGRIHVRVVARLGSVELFVGPLRAGGASDLIASAALPGVGNVLERVADDLEPREREDNGDGELLLIRLDFDAQRPSKIDRMESDVT
jgi:serine/threonine-protein kinase RsbW